MRGVFWYRYLRIGSGVADKTPKVVLSVVSPAPEYGLASLLPFDPLYCFQLYISSPVDELIYSWYRYGESNPDYQDENLAS